MYMKTIAELEAQLTAISEQIKELKNKPKFEVGRWYKSNYTKTLFYLTIPAVGDKQYGYGFGHDGRWHDLDESEKYWNELVAIPATTEEVKSALVKEAEKRGFKEGVNVKSLLYAKGKIDSNIFSFDITKNNTRLYVGENGQFNIFDNGQWAEIIKDDVIKIGGYDVEIHKDNKTNGYTLIDEHQFTYEFWLSARFISEHSKAKIMVGCSKQFDVSLEVINAILAKL